MANLSPRLAAIAANIPKGSAVADIGTDHALLPIYLISSNICNKAYGGDINPGPYTSALQAVKAHRLENHIEIRKGDGLEIIKPGEADTIVIAGMGGPTIVEILTAAPEVLKYAKRLVLQPMIASGQVRLWLAENGWIITDENLVKDDNRIYEIITADPGQEDYREPLKTLMGPVLLEKKPPLLKEHLERLLAADMAIYEGLLKGKNQSQSRIDQVNERIEYMKKVIACL